MNNDNKLYIFKFSATDFANKKASGFLLATSKDECELVLSVLGYKNSSVKPIGKNEKQPDLKKKVDTKELVNDFSTLSNDLAGNKSLLDSIVDTSHKSKNNKEIFEQMTYFIYRGDTLAGAMKKMGDAFPKEIIDEISLGELSDDLSNHLNVIINKYGSTKNIKEQDSGETEEIEGIDIHDDSEKIAEDYKKRMYPFKYTAIDENGKKKTGYFDAESIDDCTHFLEHSGFTKIHVEPRKSYDVQIILNNKINLSSIAFDLTQLSTYLKAGIPLVDAVDILAKQTTNIVNKTAYSRLEYDLLKGDNLSTAMLHQGDVFPKLLINMIKSAEMTGDLSSVLDDMAEYYEDAAQTKKSIKSAMTYPLFVLLLAVVVLVFMLLEIVPQFVTLYQTNDAELPAITTFVMNASDNLVNNWMYILIGIVSVVTVFIVCYKNIRNFRKGIQTFLMHVPGIGKLIIYNEVYNFTKTFASLINHGVFITDSMQILSNISTNEVYKDLIKKTMINLAKGNKISDSFKNEWAFPMVAYHMLVTGESTGQLGLMMEKVSEHYKQLYKSMTDQFKSMIEPIMIVFVAGIVGVILLSIVTPMFGMYDQIK